ncbi:C4-dicarboxylate TRAP transporter substrate-binding protein [Salipiger abyssi]|uniref:C4-dicarboxylate TRAP transporter substrate-binding protein n=1 Tax=Salipiger abyssi TaxID=1250539 RepID=UPI001A8ECDE0|nr:C4-dicarboxylate TRAP transporter substrate-binding protein [Salipiger abyssi]MBN9887165.1 C4-dicarboxylate TRAP transporter substrate-binding protein [Salipiger abyssi]
MNRLTRMAGSACLLACMSGTAMADQLSYASGWPPGASVTPVFESFAKTLEEKTGGDLSMKVYSLSLLNFLEANEGVKNGLADLITLLPPYFASEYPHLNMISETSSVMALEGNESELPSFAFAGMMTELVMLDCPSCQEEMKKQSQVMLGVAMTTPYMMACVTDIASADDLNGKRFRAAGAYWSRWAEAMGAVPVSMSINETFEALEQGVLDCTLSNGPDLANFSLNEVVDRVYVGAPSGMFPFPTTMNIDRWQGLSDEHRAALLESSAELIAGLAWDYHIVEIAALEDVVARGNTLTDVPDDVQSATRDFLASDLAALSDSYKERFGMEGGDMLLQKIKDLAPRWIELVEGVSSEEQLAEIFWQEIFSKVDPASYGQ